MEPRVEDNDDLELRFARQVSFQLETLPPSKRKIPIWCWPLLAASVCAVSSAGAVFQKMGDVPPITLAAWRLQVTTVLLAVGAAFQWGPMPSADKHRTKKDLLWLLGSGTSLAIHFATWVFSLQHTSLPHSMLFVSTSPVILVTWSLLRCQKTSWGEIFGSLLAMAGGAILAIGAVGGQEQQVTLKGDAAAFAAAVAVVIYLEVGKKLRAYQPIFVYAAFVTGWAALLLSVTGFAAGGWAVIATDHHGLFGWASSKQYAPLILYLAIGPGIVGHTGFNTLLKYLTSLTIALAVQLEPVLGPCIGWFLGVTAPPGVYTYVGGAVVLAAAVLVCIASAKRQEQEEKEEEGYRAMPTQDAGPLGPAGSTTSAAGWNSLPSFSETKEAGGSPTEGGDPQWHCQAGEGWPAVGDGSHASRAGTEAAAVVGMSSSPRLSGPAGKAATDAGEIDGGGDHSDQERLLQGHTPKC